MYTTDLQFSPMLIFYRKFDKNGILNGISYFISDQNAVAKYFCTFRKCRRSKQVLNHPDEALLYYEILCGGNSIKVLN